MKNIFSINTKTNELNSNSFLLREADEELEWQVEEARYREISTKPESPLRRRGAPFPFVFAFFIVFSIAVFVAKWITYGFSAAYSEYGWTLYFAIVFTVLGVALFIIFKKLLGKPKSRPEWENLPDLNTLIVKTKEQLHVPEICTEMDVLENMYRAAPDKPVTSDSCTNFVNMNMWVFKESDRLCFANASGVWGVPLISVTAIVKVNKATTFANWNKSELPSAEKFNGVVKVNNHGIFTMNHRYSVRLMRGGEEWEFLIPPYEIDKIVRLTGITPSA